MAEKIAFLLKSHFIEYCRSLLDESWNGCELSFFSYETISELQALFLKQKNQFDAFVISGTVPLNAIKAVDKPPYALSYYLGSYLENTYRLLLNHILTRRKCNPERIGIDYLTESDDLQNVINEDRLPALLSSFEQSISGLDGSELETFEQQLVSRYLEQYRKGKLDFVVTNFYSVVEALKKENIECFYSYPSRLSIIQTLELCKKDIILNKMRGNMAAVIRISPVLPANTTSNDQELFLLTVKGHLLEYCRLYHCEPIIKDDFTDIEIYISKEQFLNMSDNLSGFDLAIYLKGRAKFEGIISVGMGESLNLAKLNAEQAKLYASKLNEPFCICIDEHNGVVSIPICEKSKKPALRIPREYITEVANISHLSEETVYRVVSTMRKCKSDRISSYDLIREEEFSACTASRALKSLENNGYAQIVGQKRIGGKGRPLNIFQINLPEESKAF